MAITLSLYRNSLNNQHIKLVYYYNIVNIYISSAYNFLQTYTVSIFFLNDIWSCKSRIYSPISDVHLLIDFWVAYAFYLTILLQYYVCTAISFTSSSCRDYLWSLIYSLIPYSSVWLSSNCIKTISMSKINNDHRNALSLPLIKAKLYRICQSMVS